MNIIKIGKTYINLDNVASISPVTMEGIQPGTMEVEFIGRQNEDWGSMWFEGDDAVVLRRWLDRNCPDLTKSAG
jgi:hypothetical protein